MYAMAVPPLQTLWETPCTNTSHFRENLNRDLEIALRAKRLPTARRRACGQGKARGTASIVSSVQQTKVPAHFMEFGDSLLSPICMWRF